ncbi:hypothetical protein ABZZ79_23200 [Streptomyces sp. NPDC006458]|uniref:hypothetical protein n=1 Tax=Streptomyces sp. NPDC006458 TaxID=3154302 RepID=UPI0033AC56BE
MRVMLKASMDTEKANELIRSGKMADLLKAHLERIRPEAAYFGAENGKRTCYLVLDLQDSSDMPKLAEPFFMELGAGVQFSPVMNVDDLQRGLAQLG